MLTNLDMSLYEPGHVIIDKGEDVEELRVVVSGKCLLFGYYSSKDGEEHKALITKIPEKGWFGDFQILLDLESTW